MPGDCERKYPHLPPVDLSTVTHGRRGTYVYYGCWFDECTRASTRGQKVSAKIRYDRKKKEALGLSADWQPSAPQGA